VTVKAEHRMRQDGGLAWSVWPWGAAAVAALVGAVVLARGGLSEAAPATGLVTGKTDRPSVLVYLEGVPGAPAEAPTEHMRVTQKELAFAPGVTIAIKGTTIDFPNEDKVFHNVFSLSEPARFDLGLYKSGDSRSVQFNRAGVVDIYCNIHPQMAAKVKVLDTRYYAISGNDGTFLIPNVPGGTYPIIAWQAYGDPARGTVTVEAGRVASITLALPPESSRGRHLRKDGTPYGRYQ
jgi:plastocyanin